MRVRRVPSLLPAAGVVSLVGCGFGLGDSSSNCGGSSGKVCSVGFEGPGEKELPSPYEPGTTVELRTVVGATATVRVKGEDAELVEGAAATKPVGGLFLALTKVSGRSATLLITPE